MPIFSFESGDKSVLQRFGGRLGTKHRGRNRPTRTCSRRHLCKQQIYVLQVSYLSP